MSRLDMYTHLDYVKTGHVYTFRLSRLWQVYTFRLTRLDMYTHLYYVETGHVYTFRLKTGHIYTHLD